MEIIAGGELKLATLLDLYVDYRSGNSSSDSSNDSPLHGWLQRNNHKILLWPQCVSFEDGRRLNGSSGNAQ